MGNRPLEILPAAAHEALEAAQWYGARSEKAGIAFSREIKAAFARIRHLPETWPAHHHGTRRVLLNRFPYEVVYRVYPERLLVVAVAHCKRRPAYWRGR